jgi:hypothetical protein
MLSSTNKCNKIKAHHNPGSQKRMRHMAATTSVNQHIGQDFGGFSTRATRSPRLNRVALAAAKNPAAPSPGSRISPLRLMNPGSPAKRLLIAKAPPLPQEPCTADPIPRLRSSIQPLQPYWFRLLGADPKTGERVPEPDPALGRYESCWGIERPAPGSVESPRQLPGYLHQNDGWNAETVQFP